MKRLFIFTLMLTGLFAQAQAQLPENPQDIAPLLVGEAMPEMQLTGADGQSYATGQLLAQKPTVLIFYRGGWCPYCNRHLSAVGMLEEQLLELGYQVVAVSPDAPEKLKGSQEKQGLNYTLLSDANGSFTQAAGLAFQAPEKYRKMLAEHSGNKNTGFLPVPALFILDKEGKILFEHVNPDYSVRIDDAVLLAVAKALQ